MSSGIEYLNLLVASDGQQLSISARGAVSPVTIGEDVKVSGTFDGFSNHGTFMFMKLSSLQVVTTQAGNTQAPPAGTTQVKPATDDSNPAAVSSANSNTNGSAIVSRTDLVNIAESTKAAWTSFTGIMGSNDSVKVKLDELNNLDSSYDLFHVIEKLEEEKAQVPSDSLELYQQVHDFTEDVDKSILFTIASLNQSSRGEDASLNESMATDAIQGASNLSSSMP